MGGGGGDFSDHLQGDDPGPRSASGSWTHWRSCVLKPREGRRVFSATRQRRSWAGPAVNANAYSTFEAFLDRAEIR
eukprot:2892855-Pyramimonas_sp.AAC.1